MALESAVALAEDQFWFQAHMLGDIQLPVTLAPGEYDFILWPLWAAELMYSYSDTEKHVYTLLKIKEILKKKENNLTNVSIVKKSNYIRYDCEDKE